MVPSLFAKQWKVHKTGFNHYSTECLIKAGGREEGVMDFVQYVKSPSSVFNTNTNTNANIYCIFNINQRSCTNWISTANTPFLLVATSNEFRLFLLVVNTTVYYHRFYKYIPCNYFRELCFQVPQLSLGRWMAAWRALAWAFPWWLQCWWTGGMIMMIHGWLESIA